MASTESIEDNTAAANAALEALAARMNAPAGQRTSFAEALAAVSGLTHNPQFQARFVEASNDADFYELPLRAVGGCERL